MISATVLAATVMSCQKDDFLQSEVSVAVDNQIAGDYEVQGGILHFRDSDAFTKTQKALSKMTRDERLKFSQALGFNSLLSYYDDFEKASTAATDQASYKKALTQYADIVTLSDGQTPVFVLQSPYLSSLVDRARLLYIGKILYRFENHDQTMVLDGDIAKLNEPESASVKHLHHEVGSANARKQNTICRYFNNKEAVSGSWKSVLTVNVQTTASLKESGQYQVTLEPYAIGNSYTYNNRSSSWQVALASQRMFAHWKYSAYSTEFSTGTNTPGAPDFPYDVYANVVTGSINSFVYDYHGSFITFSNLNNPGSVYDTFDFPTDSGWHEMTYSSFGQSNTFQNSMSCP